MKTKHTLYRQCICFRCSENRRNTSPDCACDNGPCYVVEACAFCPKRGFCDVAKNPWDYKPEELPAKDKPERRKTVRAKRPVQQAKHETAKPDLCAGMSHGSCKGETWCNKAYVCFRPA
jgi:hypothetical protein